MSPSGLGQLEQPQDTRSRASRETGSEASFRQARLRARGARVYAAVAVAAFVVACGASTTEETTPLSHGIEGVWVVDPEGTASLNPRNPEVAEFIERAGTTQYVFDDDATFRVVPGLGAAHAVNGTWEVTGGERRLLRLQLVCPTEPGGEARPTAAEILVRSEDELVLHHVALSNVRWVLRRRSPSSP